MKRQILVGVAFCSLCLNAYAFNPAAEKAQDAQPVSCNIPAMLNDAKNAQWFRPQCIRILAASEARGNLNQSQKAQLKEVLVPAYQNIMEYYSVRLDDERAQKEAPHFMELNKSLALLADEQGTYGLTPGTGVYLLTKDKKIKGSSKTVEVVGRKADVKMGKAPLYNLLVNVDTKVSLAQQSQAENAAHLRKRKPGELTAGLPKDSRGEAFAPAFDVRHLENVFCFDNDAQLEEKDFVFDIHLLNDMLKERRDFMPLLNFMAENASFNKNHPNYIPPRFVRLVLAYHAENLAPKEASKLVKYAANPAYSPDFRFLAGTVASAYAYSKGTNASYKGKFRYSPKEAAAIMGVLQLKATGAPQDAAQVELLSRRVRPYMKGQLLLPVEKNKKAEWLNGAALTRALATTITSEEFISLAKASAPESLLACGGILVIGGAVYTVSEALSPLYRKQFKESLEDTLYVEVPEKYIPASTAENMDDYEVVNGKVLIPTTDAAAQARQAKSVLEEIFGNVELDEDGELMRMAPVIWDKFTMARVGTSATKLEAEKEKEPTCHYDDKVSKNIHIPLYLVGNLLNPGDKTTRLRAWQLRSCLAKSGYCPPLTPGQEEGAVSSWFLGCKNTHLNRVKVSAECRADAQELNRIFKQLTSFKDNKGRRLYARAVYYRGKWVAEAEMSVFTQTPLMDMLSTWVQDAILNNGKLRITDGPESIGKNYVYRNGTHEQSTRYHFSEETNEIGKGGKLQHFHYEEIKPYAYTYNKQMYRGIFKCNHSIVYQPK